MMKSRVVKIITNSVGLAAMAALGITVYQLGTSPLSESDVQEERSAEDDGEESGEENPLVDAGTSQVEADMEEQDEFPADSSESGDGEEAFDDTDSAAEGMVNTESADSSDTENAEIPDAGETTEPGVNPETEEGAQETAAAVYPEISFSEDTLMEWPVSGNILVDYSMDQTTYFPTLDQYRLSSAIAVQSEEGAPVTAAVRGAVYSIEQDAQTGTTMTMDLGNGYQAVYGQLTDLAFAVGDRVEKGDIIGYVSAPTKYYSTEGSNLYFAMLKDGEPVDPITYLP